MASSVRRRRRPLDFYSNGGAITIWVGVEGATIKQHDPLITTMTHRNASESTAILRVMRSSGTWHPRGLDKSGTGRSSRGKKSLIPRFPQTCLSI